MRNQESRERLSRNRTGQSPGIFVVLNKAIKPGTARIKDTSVYKGYKTQDYPQLCNVLNNWKAAIIAIKMRQHKLRTTFTSLIWGADSPGHGTGTWISEEPQMTLTYRGKKYVQLQGAGFDSSKKALLTYRGIPYAKWSPLITMKASYLTVGGFFLEKALWPKLSRSAHLPKWEPSTYAWRNLHREHIA